MNLYAENTYVIRRWFGVKSTEHFHILFGVITMMIIPYNHYYRIAVGKKMAFLRCEIVSLCINIVLTSVVVKID